MLDSEIVIFKKKIKMLEAFKGKGTELISVYIPPETDRGAVMGQLSDEMSQSSNIKSPQTRKNVQGALKRISNFLKQINFKIPETGLVVFSGNVSEKEGVSDIRLFTVHPPTKLKTKLYWCDSEFHLAPLKEMATPTDTYALIAMDKREATIALLIGKKYDIMAHYTSAVPGKIRAGGQSALRFERLREEAAQDFYKRISEKVNMLLIDSKNLRGIIVGGPGGTKHNFLEKDMIDYRLKPKILGTVDITYTDESGIREVIQKSTELLKESEAIQEKQIVQEFFMQLAKNSLGVFGEKETEQALTF
ncbi:MAG: peptide chain release factor aRF-1, partial [archaeon]|nr:peptide chain release factor aRF-1 [archaeon]